MPYQFNKHLYVQILLGFLPVILGCIVIFGWYVNSQMLVQVFPNFAPMQYNTALGFLLSGLGFLFLISNHIRLQIFIGVLLALLGGATLLEYILQIDIGIDEFFMDHSIATKTSHPGRMAPNTALCFLLCGFAYCSAMLPKDIIVGLGAAVLILSILALSGYMFDKSSIYGWGSLTRMAIHTAVGFSIIGGSLIYFIFTSHQKENLNLRKFLPVTLSIISIVLTIFSWYVIHEKALKISGENLNQFSNTQIYTSEGSYIAPIILILGTILSVLLYIALAALIRGKETIEKEIIKKTAELKKSNQMLGMAEQKANLGHWRYDVKANSLFWSDQIYTIHGVKKEQYIPDLETAIQFYHPDDQIIVKQKASECLDTGNSFEFELRIILNDNQKKYVHSTGHADFDINHNILGIFGTFQDITLRKKAEDEILRSNEELERFAYIASHDLQEPLRMVTNFSSLLKEEYYTQLDEGARNYIDYIKNNSSHMQDLVADLLQYSRVDIEDSGVVECDLNAQIEKILEVLTSSIKEINATIFVGEMPTIDTYPMRFTRLIQNLISNAMKYRDTRRPLEINISAQERSQDWLFSISDNGIGIKNEYLEQIFTIFKRLQHKHEYSGTGLGLAICKKIIDSFKGTIWAESKIDEGSIFYFTIPKLKENFT